MCYLIGNGEKTGAWNDPRITRNRDYKPISKQNIRPNNENESKRCDHPSLLIVPVVGQSTRKKKEKE